MPRCIHCNETYADQLRRCPYCGQVPDMGPDALAALGQAAAPVSAVTLHARRRRRNLYVFVGGLLAALGLLSVGSLVLFTVDKDPDPLDVDLGSGSTPALVLEVDQSNILPDGIRPQKVDLTLKVTSAVATPRGIVVEGVCSPMAIVRVAVDGHAAVIDPLGNRWRAVVPLKGTEVHVVGEGLNDDRAERTAKVDSSVAPDKEPRRVPMVSHAEGQTVHTRTVELKLSAVVRNMPRPDPKTRLTRVENRVSVGPLTFTIYRAPKGLVYLRTTSKGQQAFLRKADGQEMVLVPAGLSKRGMGKDPPHGPLHIVRTGPYLIDRSEVTCAQYATFLDFMRRVNDPSVRHPEDDGADLLPLGWVNASPPSGTAHLPVTGVNWFAAHAYARWVGGRLPSEAEWERAAAGPHAWSYPWGEGFDSTRCQGQSPALIAAVSMLRGESYYSVLHMAGNAREWCTDRYDPRWYLRSSRSNPRGPSRNKHRVIRGGSYASSLDHLRLQYRDHGDPKKKVNDTGFRVVIRWSMR